jgi:hypothetical protein
MGILIVVERPTVPFVLIEGIAVDNSETLDRVDAELCRAQPDDWTQAFMGIMDCSVLFTTVSLPLYPSI